jgi:flagellar hook-associated protein 1 FlgK
MSGIGVILSIAKDALAAQRYSMDVTAHNIANVNTQGYSRQSPILEARESAPYAGLILGRGVSIDQVLRSTDQFIENRLIQQQSSMLSSKETESYIQLLEGLFNENSESSISAMLADFWNFWHDISNNPSGAPERIALYEQSVLLSEQFNTLDADLDELERDLTNAVSAGIVEINQITDEIAQINDQIVGMETTNTANDLRDQRNALVSELSEYIDVKTFEQSNGSLTVITAKGCVLVQERSSYDLELSGDNGDRVKWQGSGGVTVDITDYITKGKLGGWLDMRDEVITKYRLDLDAVAREFIWAVNQQHTEGVGLEAFSTVTGTYRATDETAALDLSGLSFADKIVDGGLRLWLYESDGDYDSDTTLTIDANVTSIDDIVAAINAIDATKIAATTVDGKLQINGVNNYKFAFSDDTSNVLAALGINTFFSASTAGGIGVNDKIDLDKNYIAAAEVQNNVGPAVASSNNTGTGTIVTSGRHTGTTDATFNIEITTTGDETDAQLRWNKDGGTWTAVNLAVTGSTVTLSDGVTVTFMPGSYDDTTPDTFTINVTANSSSYGTFASGDNTNALAIADLQYRSVDISQWTCDRISGNTEGSVNATLEDYYHTMVGSIGIISASISRSRAFNEVMVNKLSEIRDSISAVSLDEEMTNLIKFQNAYAAAAKLITISDEMLETLLSVR